MCRAFARPALRPPLVARRVEPELLDQLPADHPDAIRSRRDLRRVNAWMGNPRILARLLTAAVAGTCPRTLAEIGGGDGHLLLSVARRLPPAWHGPRQAAPAAPATPAPRGGVEASIVDRQNLVASATQEAFCALGWSVRAEQSDVFHWLAREGRVDVIVANLFLHHFQDEQLRELLEQAAAKTDVFVACEPRRLTRAGFAGLFVRLIGGNYVTRHDAVKSVRAGFAGHELTALWPRPNGWETSEDDAGFFSHTFAARRVG